MVIRNSTIEKPIYPIEGKGNFNFGKKGNYIYELSNNTGSKYDYQKKIISRDDAIEGGK